MDDIRNIVSAIRDIADTEVHAEEKLFLWWKKLFLVEKNMSNRDKKGLIFLVNDYLMKKRVYQFDLNKNTMPNDDIEVILSSVIKKVYTWLREHSYISEDNMDTCYNSCKEAAIYCYECMKALNLESVIIHTSELNLNLVPHFFVVVKYNNRNYVVDMTFRQFLTVPFFIPERVYHFQNNFLSPACFGNIDFFEELGAKGYFEATPENLSCYLGGFAKANKSAQVHNVSELYTINQANIDVDRYIDLLYERLDNFSIERYCSYL